MGAKRTTTQKCAGTVDECTNPACLWRGGNHPWNPCTKCGAQVAPRPCKRYPRAGTTVCDAHGANQRTVAAGAQRVELDRIAGEAAALFDRLDIPDLHPLDGLLDAVRITGTWARVFGTLVRELDLKPTVRIDVIEGPRGGQKRVVVTENESLYGPDHNEDAKPHVLVEMHRIWLEQHTRACKLALDAGIDERRLQLAESDVDQLMTAITRALVAAQLPPNLQEAFTMALAQELRALGPA